MTGNSIKKYVTHLIFSLYAVVYYRVWNCGFLLGVEVLRRFEALAARFKRIALLGLARIYIASATSGGTSLSPLSIRLKIAAYDTSHGIYFPFHQITMNSK